MKPSQRVRGQGGRGAGQTRPLSLALLLFFGLLTLVLLTPGQWLKAADEPAPAPSPASVLEELHYQVDVWLWQDALKAKLTFQEVAPGRFRAELKGRAQGLLALLSGQWQGSLSTEMEYVEGKLRPLVYREASQRGDKKKLMEYRFDYSQNKVELFKQEKGQPLAKRWETTLSGPMYDPLTFFYNRRLAGAGLGFKGGENLKFQGIPYPKPDEIALYIGGQTPEGRKIMVELGNRIFKGERSQVYAYVDADGIPTKAWTHVLAFGRVNISLLPGGRRLPKEALTKPAAQARAVAN